jgi:ubiquinone/menaquinone biosynthesis C-methylase UbiE
MHRYNLTADMYDSRYRSEQEAKYEAALGCVSLRGAAVLDVGCGTGLLFSHVASNAEIVVGVDLSKGLLLLANARARQFCNVHVVQADADFLPFKSGFFEVLFAFTVLQNMPNPSRMLSEITGIVKPDARIAVSALKKIFSKHELENLLVQAGLNPISVIDSEQVNCYVAVSSLDRNSVA